MSTNRSRFVLSCLTIAMTGLFFYSYSANPYQQRFLVQYNKIHNPANGYFSQEGVPYHSIETMIIEAPSVVTLYTSNGRAVLSRSVNGCGDISLRGLACGSYVAQLSCGKSPLRKMVAVER